MLALDTKNLMLNLYPNGRVKVPVVIWRRGTDDQLLADEVALTNADARAALVKRLPEELREEASGALADAVVRVLKGEGREPADEKKPAVNITDPEPWPEPVDGAALLEEVRSLLGRYLHVPKGADRILATFVLSTYLASETDTATYILMFSPVPGCGKSTTLEMFQMLVWRPWYTTVVSTAVLFRTLESARPTLLLDEAEVVQGRGDAAGDIRAILNSGHKRNGPPIPRCVGDSHEVTMFRIYGPKVFALIGELPPTLFDRCIPVKMEKAQRGEVKKVRSRRVEVEAKVLRRKLRRWAEDHRQALAAAIEQDEVPVPEELSGHQAETWEPLLAIAHLIGGDWNAALRKVAEAFTGVRSGDQDLKLDLLTDIRELITGQSASWVTSAYLVKGLKRMQERQWAEYKGKGLTPHGLARLLKDFSIQPTDHWVPNEQRALKAYACARFEELFARYLAPSGSPDPSTPVAEPRDSEDSSNGAGNPTISNREEVDAPRALKSQENADGASTSRGLAVETPGVEGSAEIRGGKDYLDADDLPDELDGLVVTDDEDMPL